MNAVTRFKNYCDKFGRVNTARKILYLFVYKSSIIPHYFRKLRFYFRTKCWVHYIGRGVVLRGIANLIIMGKDIALYEKVIFEISEEARLKIGDHFILSYGGLIACHYDIEIGNHVMIGEYTSIRDVSHDYAAEGISFIFQKDIPEAIKIGNNVWIGRGCIILPGTIIEDGVIIGANSVVKGYLRANGIYAGAPLKMVRQVYSKV